MKRPLKLLALAPALIFGWSISAPAFAQNAASPPSASQSLQRAGTETENAAKDALQGTETVLSDTDITAKVELALHDSSVAGKDDIHVSTTAGIVTLSGASPSAATATQAAQIAQSTAGVRGVKNLLSTPTSAAPSSTE
ncbi:MAG TPA: BON domain-containing protein [Candidatus Binataceae bacterium]|nr:BON domain-containing protein [Candidatus Binataceae bacterium]